MKKNEFIDSKKEFVIRNMYPLRPWLNYSWNTEYVSSFNQFGFGISRHSDKNRFIKNILAKDSDNRLIFIKDRETKEYWAANRNYDNKDFETFETVVGMGYSDIKSEYSGIKTDFKIFVPKDGIFECWEVTVKNTDSKDRRISLYAYAEIDTALSPMDGYSKADYNKELKGIYASHDGFKMPTEFVGMYLASNVDADAYETSNRRFKGVYSDIGHPIGIENDKLESFGTCFEFNVGATLQFDLDLKANDEKKLLFVLGTVKSANDAIKTAKDMLSETKFDAEFNRMINDTDDFQQNVTVNTPDEDINRRINIWLKRQIEIGMQWGRLYGKGFRDVLQDTTGFLPLNPEKARERIVYATRYQRANGNPVRQWDPLMEEVYADGAVWLIYAVNAYLKETGDFSILDEIIPYFDSDEEESLLDHCMRGIDYVQNNIGKRGMCLWFNGDWNDSIDAAGLLGRGESLWLSEATVKAANELVEILEKINKTERVAEILDKKDKMVENIFKYGWDGDHFIYGINDFDEKIGTKENKEGKAFLNTQTWAVLSGIVKGDKALDIMNYVEDKLCCDYGYLQNYPSYCTKDPKIGRLTYFDNGIFENGSVYNHGVAFKAVADCMIGDGNRAIETIRKILPTNPKNPSDKSGVEPYVMSNMYFGPENPTRPGAAPQSWITGTSGWLFRCLVENIVGIQADFDGLKIEPKIPDDWHNITAKRKFRNAIYDITIISENKDSEFKLTVDGKELDGNIVPIFDAGVHTVTVKR